MKTTKTRILPGYYSVSVETEKGTQYREYVRKESDNKWEVFNSMGEKYKTLKAAIKSMEEYALHLDELFPPEPKKLLELD